MTEYPQKESIIWTEIKSKMIWEPENITKKHLNQYEWKRTVYLETGEDVHLYYRWFIEKRFGLKLNKPLRPAHITIINDRVDDWNLYQKSKSKFNGAEINISWSNQIRTNGKHWWLRAKSNDALLVRQESGFSKIPYHGMHLSIGYVNDLQLDYSMYIFRQLLLHGI